MLDKVYLAKIGLGMAGVFGVGMIVTSAIGAGRAKVNETVHTNADISVPLLGLPFRTAKGEIGSLKHLTIERSAPKMIEAFRLAVELQDGVSASQFNDCEVTVADPENIDENTRFTCLTAADVGFDELVQFGTITFAPSGAVHRLMIPSAMRDRIQHRDPANDSTTGDATADPAEGSEASEASEASAPGNLTIKVNGKNIVDIRGDTNGGRVRITDPATGKTIVDVEGGPRH